VMPLPTPYMLLNTHSTATATSHASKVHSTATAKVPTTSLPNTTPKQQEILMLNKDLIFIDAQANGIDSQLAIMYAWLKTGHIERALKIYKSLNENYPDQKERLTSVNICNAFIEAYMKRGGEFTRRASNWFDAMRRLGIKPNLTTYAILIKGFIQAGTVNTARLLLMEMLKEGYSITAFMLNRNISDNELRILKLICKSKGRDHFVASSVQINKLLSAMRKPATEPTETSIDLSSVPAARSTDALDVHLLNASLAPVEAKDIESYERQLHFEEQTMSASLERLRVAAEEQNPEASSNSDSLRSLMWSWHQKLYPMIVEEQQRVRDFVGKTDTLTYGPFLLLLDAEKLSILTIQQLLRLNTDRDVANGVRATRAMNEIGSAIEMEYYTEQLRECKNRLVKARQLNLQASYSSGQLFDMHTREIQTKLLMEEEDGDWLVRWPKFIRLKLGSLLISMLLRAAKIKTTYYDKETGKHA
jgi:DNA-directed RNA polymerase